MLALISAFSFPFPFSSAFFFPPDELDAFFSGPVILSAVVCFATFGTLLAQVLHG